VRSAASTPISGREQAGELARERARRVALEEELARLRAPEQVGEL